VIAASAAAPGAWAGTCLEQVHGFAVKYDIKVDPPDAGRVPSTRPPAPEDLSESDGVIEPAPRRSPAVIEPPAGTDPRMTTLPDVPPMVKEQTDGEPRRLSPADRAALKATLMSARAEALRGQEKDCFARLEKAKAIVLPAE
jgi:hypothetical protein